MTVKFSGFAAGSAIAGTDIPVGLQSSNNVQWTWNQIATFMWNNPVFTGTITIPGTLTLGSGPALLSSPVAAALQLGAPDAGAPVAQTLQVQNVVAGTSNTAGQNLTIKGSAGTGTGTAGTIIFQIAPAGSSGTSQNAFSTALTINADGSLTSTGTISSVNTVGARITTTGAGQPAVVFPVGGTASLTGVGTATVQLGSSDVASPAAQTLQAQSVVTGTTNAAGQNLTIIGSKGTGTGVGGDIIFQTAQPGGSGSSQNAVVEGFRIQGNAQSLAIGTGWALNFGGLTPRFGLASPQNATLNLQNNAGLIIQISVPSNNALQLGAPDAASPVAQTLQQQSVVAGTSNTAGVALTFRGSLGTGTGAPGALSFAVGSSGNTTGATQNAAATLLALQTSSNQGSDATANVSFTPTWNTTGSPTAILLNVVNTASGAASLLMNLNLGGVSQFNVSKSGSVVSTGSLTAGSGSSIGWSARALLFSGADGALTISNNAFTNVSILSIPTSNTIQFGAADAASPVAQTLGVQNVVAGTSNTAGVNFTINGSKGTGTGAGGNIIFQTAPAGGSGTSQNAFVSSFILSSTSAATTFTTAGNFNLSSAGSVNITATSGFGGSLNSGGTGYVGWNGASAIFQVGTNALPQIQLNSNGWLTSPGAATWQLGQADAGSPVAQVLQVQNVSTGTTNGNGVNWTLNGSTSTGSGTAGDIIFQTGGTGAGATSQNAQVSALTIKGATQQALFSNLVRIYNGTAIPAGGTTGTGYLLSSTANFGTFFGSGAPTLSAAEGSLYLRSDGTPQINTSGSTTWFDLASQASYAAKLAAVNFNSANTDTSFNVTLPPGFTRYRLAIVVLSHASASISTATFGLFSAAAGGGTAIVTGQAITVTANTENTNQNMQLVVPTNAGTQSFNFSQLFFRVQTAQGSAATADVHIVINPIL